MRKDTPENQVKRVCNDWLSLMGFFHFPIMQALGSYAGIPDRIAMKDGHVLFIEYKGPNGHMSEAQIKFEADTEKAGCNYVLAKDYKDIEEFWEQLTAEE